MVPNDASKYIDQSGIRAGDNYYVVCKDTTEADFFPVRVGNYCDGYTDGIRTYYTPATCYPENRMPTLDEFDAQVGLPFCSAKTKEMLPITPGQPPFDGVIASITPDGPTLPIPWIHPAVIAHSETKDSEGLKNAIYDVTCKNGTASTFTMDMSCCGYTNGPKSYTTPTLCAPQLLDRRRWKS